MTQYRTVSRIVQRSARIAVPHDSWSRIESLERRQRQPRRESGHRVLTVTPRARSRRDGLQCGRVTVAPGLACLSRPSSRRDPARAPGRAQGWLQVRPNPIEAWFTVPGPGVLSITRRWLIMSYQEPAQATVQFASTLAGSTGGLAAPCAGRPPRGAEHLGAGQLDTGLGTGHRHTTGRCHTGFCGAGHRRNRRLRSGQGRAEGSIGPGAPRGASGPRGSDTDAGRRPAGPAPGQGAGRSVVTEAPPCRVPAVGHRRRSSSRL